MLHLEIDSEIHIHKLVEHFSLFESARNAVKYDTFVFFIFLYFLEEVLHDSHDLFIRHEFALLHYILDF